jgi:hypothetical protein
MRPDRWPRRTLRNGRAAGFVTNGDVAIVAQPAQMVAQPASSPLDGRAAGFAETLSFTVTIRPARSSFITKL